MRNFCEDKSYFVTENGEVYSNKSGSLKRLKTRINNHGYEDIKVQGKMYRIHVIVAECYIPNPDKKPQVNHKDGDKLKNNVDNLEWATNAENGQHAWDTGLQPIRHAINCKFTQEQADIIRQEYIEDGISQRALAKKYGVSKTTIADLLNGKYYNLYNTISNVNRDKSERKLTYSQAEEIRKRYSSENISYAKLGNQYGVNHKTIIKIIKNLSYVQEVV